MNRKQDREALDRIKAACGSDKTKEIRELKRLAKEGQKQGDLFLVGIVYHRLAVISSMVDDIDGCFTNAFKSVELLKDTDAYEPYARALVTLGYAYGMQENWQLELEQYDLAYRIIRRHRIRSDVRTIVLNNLSTCHSALKDYKTAIRYLTTCIEQSKQDDPEDYDSLLMYQINLANYHKEAGMLEKALDILSSVRDWIQKAGSNALVCDYYLRTAIVYDALGNLEACNASIDRSFACVPEDEYPVPLYDDFRQVLRLLVERKDRMRADRIIGLMTDYSEKVKGTIEQLIAFRAMADYYGGFGENERALDSYKQLDELYSNRIGELTGIQLGIHKNLRNADAEIRKLKKQMRENDALLSLEPMTKLLNRSALLKVSSEYIERAARRKQKIGAIFIDIDFFKECNDTYGHARGDEIIKEVALACRKEEKDGIRFARYGGDEFFGITYGLSDDEVVAVAKRIAGRIREADIPHEKNPNGRRITISAGVVNVVITGRTDTIIEIANYADKALYHAKNAGRNAIYLLNHESRDENGGTTASYVRIGE